MVLISLTLYYRKDYYFRRGRGSFSLKHEKHRIKPSLMQKRFIQYQRFQRLQCFVGKDSDWKYRSGREKTPGQYFFLYWSIVQLILILFQKVLISINFNLISTLNDIDDIKESKDKSNNKNQLFLEYSVSQAAKTLQITEFDAQFMPRTVSQGIWRSTDHEHWSEIFILIYEILILV